MTKVTTYLNEDKMPYLVKEKMAYKADGQYNDTQKVYELCKAIHMTERATEMVLLLIMDSAFHLIAIQEVSTGSINGSIVPIREIAQTMLLVGGVNAIMVHNHPSGDTEPSEMDISVTKKLKDALEILSLYVQDHIIVGRDEYTSLTERRLLK